MALNSVLGEMQRLENATKKRSAVGIAKNEKGA